MLALLVSACASTPSQVPRPADVEERIVIDGEVLPLPDEPSIHVESLPGAPGSSPVVARLMVSADTQRRNGDLDAAANSLERALRIEPRNARLWSRLADVRFAQKNWQQSAQLAAKSNTLSGNDTALRRQNWYLMANAYDALGDTERANSYREKLVY